MAKHRAVRVCMAYLSLCLAALALCPSAAQARKCTMKDIDISMRTDRPYAKIPVRHLSPPIFPFGSHIFCFRGVISDAMCAPVQTP